MVSPIELETWPMMKSMALQNRAGARTQHCRTPDPVLKESVNFMFAWTLVDVPLCSSLMRSSIVSGLRYLSSLSTRHLCQLNRRLPLSQWRQHTMACRTRGEYRTTVGRRGSHLMSICSLWSQTVEGDVFWTVVVPVLPAEHGQTPFQALTAAF